MIGCAVVQQHQITGPDRDVGYPQAGPGVTGDATAALAAGPQYLLHGRGNQGRFPADRLPLAGLGQQQGPGADGGDRGLVPGEQEEHRQHGDLVVAGFHGGAQPGEHVIAGLRPLAGHELLTVAEQLSQPARGNRNSATLPTASPPPPLRWPGTTWPKQVASGPWTGPPG